MLRELDDYNKKGKTETETTSNSGRPKRTRNAPELLSPSKLGFNVLHSPVEFPEPDQEFVTMFSESNLPIWNEEKGCYTTTSNTYNPFDNGFQLSTKSRLFRPFDESSNKPTGYYTVPACYLGYKPSDAPKFHLHQVYCPPHVLFGAAKAQRDPDTLSWDEAMSEDPESVKKWLEAAAKEIKELEEKGAWEVVGISEATVKVIPGTWVFRRKRSLSGEITKWKA